jgi:hypothetical protein
MISHTFLEKHKNQRKFYLKKLHYNDKQAQH